MVAKDLSITSPRVALYARVSKGYAQDPENQLIQLRAWAKASGANVTGEYVDELSSRDTRPMKEEILRQLRLGTLQGVAFVALDRWGRNVAELVADMNQAVEQGWTLISLKEGLRLDNAVGRLYAHLLAAFAEFERERIRERVNAGLARVRAQGKRLGWPKGKPNPRRKTPPANPSRFTPYDPLTPKTGVIGASGMVP